jgi:hypothetical protein
MIKVAQLRAIAVIVLTFNYSIYCDILANSGFNQMNIHQQI